MKVEQIDASEKIHRSGLSEETYDMALVSGEHEDIIDSEGGEVDWLLDLRIPLLDGQMAKKIGSLVAHRIRSAGCQQVAGYGLGGHAMVCATINAGGDPALSGGFIRPRRKTHGRRRLIEGPLDRTRPVVLLDDLLNSGATALHALRQLREEGFQVTGYYTIFEFTWGDGRSKLEKKGVWVDTLMGLTLNNNNAGSSDSAVRI